MSRKFKRRKMPKGRIDKSIPFDERYPVVRQYLKESLVVPELRCLLKELEETGYLSPHQVSFIYFYRRFEAKVEAEVSNNPAILEAYDEQLRQEFASSKQPPRKPRPTRHTPAMQAENERRREAARANREAKREERARKEALRKAEAHMRRLRQAQVMRERRASI